MQRGILPLWVVAGIACLLLDGCSRVEPPQVPSYVGQTPPEITVKAFVNAPANMPKTLAGLRGRVVLLDFFGTWCEPCRDPLLRVQEFHEKYASQGLVVLGIDPEEKDDVKPFLEEMKVTFPVALDDDKKTFHAYGVKGLPMAYLIGSDGKVIWQELTGQMIEEALQRAQKK